MPADGNIVERSSHKPHPAALLRVRRFLNFDIKAYFYPITIINVRIAPYNNRPGNVFNAQELLVIRQARNVEFEMCWSKCEDPYIPTPIYLRKRDWQAYKDRDLKALHALNAEAECLGKLVVTIRLYCSEHLELEFMLERLEELKEVKDGVVFDCGRICVLGGCAYGYEKDSGGVCEEAQHGEGLSESS